MKISLLTLFLMPQTEFSETIFDPHADTVRWALLQRKTQCHNAACAFRAFTDVGLRPILIKGVAVARHYPKSRWRPSSDVDLAFAATEFDAAVEMKKTASFPHQPVDLHDELRHLDTVDWNELFENSVVEIIEGVNIRFLSEEDHLRVICVHWLTDGGVNKDRLWDVFYTVENRRPNFDWSRCLEVVSKTRRRWIVCVIGLAHRYLDLNIEGLPFADEAKILPTWFVNEVEKEWAHNIPLRPLHAILHDPKEILKQIKKRFPPNRIQSMVDVEGSIDAPTRIHYQIGSILKRIGPSGKRIIAAVFRPKK